MRCLVQYEGDRAVALVRDGDVVWRRRGPRSETARQERTAEDGLAGDLRAAIYINGLQDSTVVMLRSQEDGGWTDRLLVTLSAASGPATRDRGHDWRSAWEWDSSSSPVVDVEYGEETLQVLDALDRYGPPEDEAVSRILRRLAVRLATASFWEGAVPAVVVTAHDPEELAADIRACTTVDERRELERLGYLDA